MWNETLEDVESTHALGVALGHVADCSTRVALYGDLGVGKTSLAQGVGVGLALNVPVVSPTFILLAEYEGGRIPLLHGDAYRLKPREFESIGMDELMDSWPGIVLIEWADLVPEVWGGEYLSVRLSHFGAIRQAEISAEGEHHLGLLERWRKVYRA